MFGVIFLSFYSKTVMFADPEAVSEAEVQSVRQVISVLSRYKADMSTSRDIEEDELCSICYALPLTVTFNPCQHRSCK